MTRRLRAVRARVRNGLFDARYALLRRGWLPSPPLDRRHRWLRTPPTLAGRRVCVLATFSADGTISAHTRFLLNCWHAQGFDVVLVVAATRHDAVDIDTTGLDDCRGIVVRNNSGYDFGSWATVLDARPDLRDAALLALTNDSLYGPLDGFPALIARVDASAADVVATTDSHEMRHHVQSFLLFFRATALRSAAFDRFWRRVRGLDREGTIQCCELPLLQAMQDGGLRVDVLFPAPRDASGGNPTLRGWRELVERGFPFVKVQLLRENPFDADIAGWDELLREHGYDPSFVRRHLGVGYERSAAAAAATSPP